MFFPKENPGYYALSENAKALIVEWTTNDWYESSSGDSGLSGLSGLAFDVDAESEPVEL